VQYLHAIFLDCRSSSKKSIEIYFTIFGAKMSKLWILETLLTFSGKHLFKSLLKSDRLALRAPMNWTQRAKRETDRWARDPTRQSQGKGGEPRRPQLAGGEVSGQDNGTTGITSSLRTQRYTRGGQWSSEDPSPPFMAERWRGWPPAGQLRPGNGKRKGARASVIQGEQNARAGKEWGGAERCGPWSGQLQW
jgi:hypothetical protein